MRYILVAITIVLLVACHNEEPASFNEMDYIVYTKEIRCRPVTTSDGFYTIAVEDSVPYFSYFDLSGKATNLLNITSYFTSDLTIDSVDNINLSLTADETFIFSFTYTDTSKNKIINAVELTQQGSVADEITWQLASDSLSLSFSAIVKTTSDNWMIVAYAQSQSGGFQPEMNSYTYLKIIQVEEGSVQSTSLRSYEGVSLDDVFILSNNSIAVSFLQNQSGMEPGMASYIKRLAIVSSPNEINEIELNDSLTQISVLSYRDNTVDLLGSKSSYDANESSSLIYIQYNSNFEKVTSFKLNNSLKFIPTCLYVADDELITGGYTSNIREFSWTDIYSSENYSTALYSLNITGEINWEKQNTSNYTEVVLGIASTDSELIWLYAKETFNLYKTTVISKTNLTGNTK